MANKYKDIQLHTREYLVTKLQKVLVHVHNVLKHIW